MGRPRTPDEKLELSGAYIKHPERRRKATPKHSSGVGVPPAAMTAEQKLCWRELARNSLPGVLTKSDRHLIETAARLTARMREPVIPPPPVLEGMTQPVQRVRDPAADMALLIRCLSLLGMTPVDRSKISIAPAKREPKSGWDELGGPPANPGIKGVIRGGKKAQSG
jgi:hypothetical protein